MNPKAKRIVIACIVAILGLTIFGAYNLGPWLRAEEPPVKSNAIIVLAGNPLRAFYGAELFNEGYAHRLYVSKAASDLWERKVSELGIKLLPLQEIFRQILVRKGVPNEGITFFGPSLSTAQEAENVRPLFQGKNCSVLVVTSPYHVRRTRMIFTDALPSCRVSVVGVPYEPFPDQWWRDQDAARNVILEVAKIVYYKSGGRFRVTSEPRGKTPDQDKQGSK